jgi:hypothetical protein
MDFSDDAEVFLQEFGKPCKSNGSEFLGILDTPDDLVDVGGVPVHTATRTLTVLASVVATAPIENKTLVEVDLDETGAFTVFTVRGPPRRIDDGVFAILTLTK